ncbi:MAG: DNA repair protein RecO [Treponema sp.]|nr:DNA repair protein RecO [Treponema sp.]
MNRTSQTKAIVLSLKEIGENNFNVTLLTQFQGIIYATLYGGPKSKLKSLVSQWNSGIIYLYHNPEKNQTKISDFDVKNYHQTFSSSLFKLYAASLAAEIAIKTKCAGSNEECWKLVSGFLDGLDLSNEEQGRVGLVRFLWRYLDLLGIRPDATYCGRCGKSFLTNAQNQTEAQNPSEIQNLPESKNQIESLQETYYNSIDNIFICQNCAGQEEHFFPLSKDAITYLAAISVLTPAEVRKLHIDKNAYMQIKNIAFFLTENSIESKLNSIETGTGIL